MYKIYDIETIKNFFSCCFLDLSTDEYDVFIIHESKNQLSELLNYLSGVKGLIGYNCLAFDSQVIEYIIKNQKFLLCLSIDECIKYIYAKSQDTIELMNGGGFASIPEWKLSIKHLDLFKIWHFDNKNKMTSLKWIEYMIDMDSIEEMPVKHYDLVNESMIESIIDYNKHDCKATKKFYNITIGNTDLKLYKGINKVQLRKDIEKETGLKCLNYNDVKIGDALNKLNYCKIKQIDKKDLPQSNKNISIFKFKDCFPKYMKFETDAFNNFIKCFQNLNVDLKKSEEKQTFEFKYNETVYLLAKGGLHSKDKPRKIIPLENEVLFDCDVGSMYPNCISKRELFPRHLGKEWLIGYRGMIDKRIQAKKDKKQAINEAYKLALNGGSFGKTNEDKSWQFDPFVTYSTTIGSQIDLLMLIEDLELSGIHVCSANTDGLVCLFDKNLLNKYYEVCLAWEKQVGNDISGKLEYQQYSKLIQTSVNDYIAVTIEGKIKTKGEKLPSNKVIYWQTLSKIGELYYN